MMLIRSFLLGCAALVLIAVAIVPAAAPPAEPPPLPDGFKDYRTVRQAITTHITRSAPTVATQPGYLGINLELQSRKLAVAGLEPNSPAARAGLVIGDVILEADGKPLVDSAALAELVRQRGPGSSLPLIIERNGKTVNVTATLAGTSRPLSPGQRVILGVQIEPVKQGIRLLSVTSGLPADKAKLKSGDILVAINGEKLAGKQIQDSLAGKRPGDTVRLTVKRGEKTFDTTVTLVSERDASRRGRGRATGWDDRRPRRFSKSVYRLAVVAIEYPDVKHNPKIRPADWEAALFSTGSYTGKSVTGQKVYGSMNDYYQEQSLGQFRVEGKFFNWVKVKRKRGEYANDSNRSALLTEALDLVQARNGKQALDGFDGIFFLYAGDRFQTRRGGLYWPHRSSVTHRGKRWNYFICPEGGRTMASISVITHEFGHMLGLPDLYARPEVPGQEGVGVWCTMSVGHGRDGKPLHFSAWCKEQMGWLKPAVIDPRVKQKLILAPVHGTTTECYKVLVKPDGSEYLLLENRRKLGFDRDLPGEGLLIWRVVDGRPILEESHGIAGPSGPSLYLGSIPYPSGSNTAFTPYTTPSSRARKDGGLPVYITNIQKLPDGRIAFQIGYEYL